MDETELILKKLKEFKKNIEKDFKIEKMILFGSRAKGKIGEEVDIDLIIVSKNFDNLRSRTRVAKMYEYWNIDYPVDFICYTPEEFNALKDKATIVKEAIKKGIKI